MDDDLQNVDVSHGIVLINICTIYQFNESSNLNDTNWGIENGDVSGGNCFMNRQTLSETKNQNSIYSTKKRDENFSNVYEIENTGLQDDVEIDIMLPASKLYQNSKTERNNDYKPP